MQVGDLAYPNKAMRDIKYPEVGIVVEVIGGRYRVAFPDGQVSVFHPAWLENHPKGNRHLLNGNKVQIHEIIGFGDGFLRSLAILVSSMQKYTFQEN